MIPRTAAHRGVALAILAASWICALDVAEGAAPIRAAEVKRHDPSTWPAPPPGYVGRFSIGRHQLHRGVFLESRGVTLDTASWRWGAKGLKGLIKVSVSRTPREARNVLCSWFRLSTFPSKLYTPAGEMVGDVSWTRNLGGARYLTGAPVTNAGGSYLGFCRRNVAVWVSVEQGGKEAEGELVRLSKAIVTAIDSEKRVAKPDFVECPVVEVRLPQQLKIGQKAAIRVVAQKPRGGELKFSCIVHAPERLAMHDEDRWYESTTAGKTRFDFEAKQVGDATVTIFVTDQDGMTTRVVKTVRITGKAAK